MRKNLVRLSREGHPLHNTHPSFLRRTGERLAERPWVREAMETKADLAAFREPPSLRLVVGVVLIILSSAMGWPAVVFFGLFAVFQKEALYVLIGPVCYGLSWLIWIAGMALAGVENVRYGRLFFRWLTRISVEWMLRH
jgi:hypothetical protein